MTRPALRRLALLLTWLALALVPLRGWAAAVMPLQLDAPAAQAQAMPHCHGEPDGTRAGDPEAGHSCAMCDLCHSSIACLTCDAMLAAPAPRGAPPGMAAVTVEPAVRSGPDRPPRTN